MVLRRVASAAAIGTVLLLTACVGQDSPSAEPGSAAATKSGKPAVTERALPDRYDPKRDPAADLKIALGLAKADGKAVLIDFGADWCPDCHVLHELFDSAATKPLLERDYHLMAVDVGEFDHNLAFAEKYIDLERSGIPALVVLSPEGEIRVATNDGSFASARNMDSGDVNAFLTKWAPKR